ncbi:hypothetical protein JCM8097_003818 [Rhodosporidiobolus ruineniae]
MSPSPPALSSTTLSARSSPPTTTIRQAVLLPSGTSSSSSSSFLTARSSRLPRRLSEDDSVREHSHDPGEAQASTAEEDAVEGDAAVPVPSLPQPNDRFSSFVAFYRATISAIVPVYGCGVTKSNVSSLRGGLKCQHYYQPASGAERCPFELVVRRAAGTDNYVVSTKLSQYTHNHPPRAEILADPTWRPKLLNKDARAALGMSPTKWGSAKEAKNTQSQTKTAGVTKAKTADGRSGGERRDESFSSHALPQLRPPDPLLPSHPSASHYPQPHADYSWTQFSRSRPAFPYQPFAVTSASSSPPHPTQLGTFAPPQPRLASSRAPLTNVHLAAFLASLHPSHASLAPNFLAAGFSSLDSLTSLTLLEPESNEAVVELLKAESEDERTRPPGGARIGVVQAKLLEKGLKEAGAAIVAATAK